MANRFFRGLGARAWGLGEPGTLSSQSSQTAQREFFSAISAISAVSAVSAFIVAACVALAAQTSDRARTEALSRRATERLQALQREADRLASEERTIIGDVRKLEIERQLKAEELR